MTRINLVDPGELHDQHLIAERREIRLCCSNIQRMLKGKKGITQDRIPSQFTLDQGHILFFGDKGLYLHKRYDLLTQEMFDRGFNPDLNLTFPVDIWPERLYNDWIPSERDKNIVRDRIALRISQKPNWYRKTPRYYD